MNNFNLSGYTLVTGPDCISCITLKNMLKKLKVNFKEIDFRKLAFLKITDEKGRPVYPVILKDGNKIFYGCPKTIDPLKKIFK